eukprot:538978_1
MGNVFSDPNKTTLPIKIVNPKCTLKVPTQMPSKWKPRIDSKMWNDTLQLLRQCEMTENRNTILEQSSQSRSKLCRCILIFLLGLIICISVGVAFADSNFPGWIFGAIIMSIAFIGSIKYAKLNKQLARQYNAAVLNNMINTINKLNVRYNGYIFFGHPTLKYHKRDNNPYWSIYIDVELKADFVEYIGDNVQIIVPQQQFQTNSNTVVINNVNDGSLVHLNLNANNYGAAINQPLINNQFQQEGQ